VVAVVPGVAILLAIDDLVKAGAPADREVGRAGKKGVRQPVAVRVDGHETRVREAPLVDVDRPGDLLGAEAEVVAGELEALGALAGAREKVSSMFILSGA